MSERDEHDEAAERLLPCNKLCGWNYNLNPYFHHVNACPFPFRAAVAAALRELGKDRDRWKKTYHEYVIVEKEQDEQIADLRTEIETLKNEVRVILGIPRINAERID